MRPPDSGVQTDSRWSRYLSFVQAHDESPYRVVWGRSPSEFVLGGEQIFEELKRPFCIFSDDAGGERAAKKY